MKDFKGKTAFITGGASGIGLGIAKVFAKNGMKVVLADLRQDALDEAVAYFEKNGGTVHPIKFNVTDREAYVRAADEAESVFGNIHILVNNAGVNAGYGTTWKLTYKDWDYAISVNIVGVVNGIMTVLPRLLKHGEESHIVSTSSTCGLQGADNMTIYCTTKFAVTGMMECLATELQNTKIGVSVLYPGPTQGNLGVSSFINRPDSLKNEGEKPAVMPGNWDGVFMNPLETGERVLRGIKRNDLFIHTHPEFKEGYIARHNALIRAIPEEPRNEKRWEVVKNFGRAVYNDLYDKQQQVGPLDW